MQLLHYMQVMVTLHVGSGWKICVYGGEPHAMPHFHIESADYRCSVAIEGREVIVGHAPNKVLRAAREWAAANKGGLMAKWQELNG